MPDLKYTIVTAADLAGAKAAQSALEKQISTAKALGQDYSELQKRYDAVTTAINNYTVAAQKKADIEQKTVAQLNAGQSARAKINKEIAASVHTVSQEEIAAATATDIATTAAKKKLNTDREISRGMRGLALQFPILSRLSELVTSKVGIAFSLAAGAVAIFVAKMQAAKERLASWELPDLKFETVEKAAAAWNGLAEARHKANTAFMEGDAVYSRAIADLQDILELQKQRLENEKQLALAQLESRKNSMTPEAYAAEQKRINQTFAQKERTATATEKRDEIARKYEEMASYQIRARNEAAAAAKLPQIDDKTFKDRQQKLQSGLDEMTAKVKKQEDDIKFLENYNWLSQHPVKNLMSKEGIAAATRFNMEYGPTVSGEDALRLARQQLKDYQQRAQWYQKLKDHQASQVSERDQHRQAAAEYEEKYQRISNELPFDIAAYERRYGPIHPPHPQAPFFMPPGFVDTRTSGEAGQDRLKRLLGITDTSQYSWGRFATPMPQQTPASPPPQLFPFKPAVDSADKMGKKAQEGFAEIKAVLDVHTAVLEKHTQDIRRNASRARSLLTQ